MSADTDAAAADTTAAAHAADTPAPASDRALDHAAQHPATGTTLAAGHSPRGRTPRRSIGGPLSSPLDAGCQTPASPASSSAAAAAAAAALTNTATPPRSSHHDQVDEPISCTQPPSSLQEHSQRSQPAPTSPTRAAAAAAAAVSSDHHSHSHVLVSSHPDDSDAVVVGQCRATSSALVGTTAAAADPAAEPASPAANVMPTPPAPSPRRSAKSLLEDCLASMMNLSAEAMVQTTVAGSCQLLPITANLPIVSEHAVAAEADAAAAEATAAAADASAADMEEEDEEEEEAAVEEEAAEGQQSSAAASAASKARGRRRSSSARRGRPSRRSSTTAASSPLSAATAAQAEKPADEKPLNAVIRKLDLPPGQTFVQPGPDDEYRMFTPRNPALIADTVEYDMDEEDYAWLRQVNEMRVKEGASEVTESMLEGIIDRFEKDCLLQAKHEAVLPYDDDAVCSVCLSGDCEDDSNAILFCDACNLPVHQDCYGVPYIPEGQWLCRRCLKSPSEQVSCVLCPTVGGAFKQTDKGIWTHVSCVMWIPEVQFGNATFKEPVLGLEDIPKARWRLVCYVCHKKTRGACIQCACKRCYTAFHVTCAQKVGLHMSMVFEDDECHMNAYCDLHTPEDAEEKPIIKSDPARIDPKTGLGIGRYRPTITDKEEYAYLSNCVEAHQGKDTPHIALPVITKVQLQSIIRKAGLQADDSFGELVRSFWMLKRRARHGVPLLRRLQAAPPQKATLSQEERGKIQLLRQDLEKARIMIGQVLRREKLKREIAELQMQAFRAQALPMQAELLKALKRMRRKDENDIFAEPVDRSVAPGYDDIIKEPMDLSTMERKIHEDAYASFDDFVSDFWLMCTNALTYNPPTTLVHEYAWDFLHKGVAYLDIAAEELAKIGVHEESGRLLNPTQLDFAISPPVDTGIDTVFRFGPRDMLTPVEVEIRNELIMARSIPRISTRVQKVMRMSAALTAIRRNDIDKIPDKYKRKAGIDGELRASKKSRLDVAEASGGTS